MTRVLLFLILIGSTFISCHDIDEDIIPVVGIYRAHVIGVAGPFDLIISTAGGDDVIIEAPFDGDNWFTAEADIANQTEPIMDINIRNQEIDMGVKMKGNGFYRDGTIELKYTMDFDGDKIALTIVGTKF